MSVYAISTPLGEVEIQVVENLLRSINLFPTKTKKTPLNVMAGHILEQVAGYFRDPSRPLDIPFRAQGTKFQQKVWQALCQIPTGETTTYGELAKALGSSPRAVGNACLRNPIPIVVPCHRVVSTHGIGGFAGDTEGELVRSKRCLLSHEGVAV